MDKNLLQPFSIFADADAAQAEAIAGQCEVLQFEAGQEIFAQDSAAQRLYGVLEGEVELVLMHSEKVVTTEIDYEEALTVKHETLEKPVVVESLEAGEVFGWSSMVVPPGRWSASARCAAATRVFSVDAAQLQTLLETEPKLGYAFMRRLGGVISQRLHHRTEKLLDVWAEAFDGEAI